MSVLTEGLSDVTLSDEIATVKRELAMRERVYGRWIEAGKMTEAKATKELRGMKAVLKRLLRAEEEGRLL